MGNSPSNHVSLTLNESGTRIVAGSVITGSVRASIPTNTSTDVLVGTTLLFVGKEDVKVRYTRCELHDPFLLVLLQTPRIIY